MVRVVGKLPVNGFHYCMPLVAYVYNAVKVFGAQTLKCGKQARPALVPLCEQFGAGGNVVLKLGIAVTPFLFTVTGQEIRPPRESMLPHKCFTITAMLLLSALYCQKSWSSVSWSRFLSPSIL